MPTKLQVLAMFMCIANQFPGAVVILFWLLISSH